MFACKITICICCLLFDYRYLRIIARVWWEHRVSNDKVCRCVLGTDSCPLIVITILRRIGHVLRVPAHCLLFACSGDTGRGDAGSGYDLA